ncbi:MAG: DUF2520 domain-containing protein [Cyclobacteriaceae bacterium]|nr:DUF2520 domain-containing protein [Cyclobacteriaceae bacterium]
MSKFYKLAIIGSGNVAWHLARALEDAGHYITDIYSRRLSTGRELARQLYDTNVVNSLDLRNSEAEIFILAISDDNIEHVAQKLKIPAYGIVAHTSGTQPLEVLSEYHENIGIFYPLQTFSKGIAVDLDEVPICIEAKHQSTEKTLTTLGKSISSEVYTVHSDDRKILHIAAVFACNFSNHMLTISEEILESHEIDFSLLHPLIVETINKALSAGPLQSQTGPARRKDNDTIKQHLKILRYRPEFRKIYKLLSENLKDHYS